MGDGKALQAGTSHNLGQNFSKAFDTTFLDEKGETRHVYQSSWGSTSPHRRDHHDARRRRGAPTSPALAPIQVVVVPIAQKNKDKAAVADAANAIATTLTNAGIRVKVDDDDRNRGGSLRSGR